MAALPRFLLADEINSQTNFWSFGVYFSCYASRQEQEELKHLYSIAHKNPWVIENPPLSVAGPDGPVHLPIRECNVEGCVRCTSGRGGWRFPWADPRWTPRYALVKTCRGAPISPYESQQLCARAWPEGVRQPPNDLPEGAREEERAAASAADL